MASIYGDCHTCGKNCIETTFCSEGASYDHAETHGISVPRNLKIRIIANPDFWGFEGTLIEGWARYENGYFDYFDGLQIDHKATKTCGPVTTGPYKNEQRPDVFYRAVYDPDTGVTHYGVDGSEDDIERGGAEVYLVDRPDSLVDAVSSDNPSCDTTKPTQVFKKFPENYGFGNKIYFKDSIYKNATGAWRLVDLNSCNESVADSEFYVRECDGTLKDHIARDDHYLTEYDPYSYRANLQSGCVQDGGIPKVYGGHFESTDSVIRNTGDSYLATININYNGLGASGLRDGMQIFLSNDVSSSYNRGYYVTEVEHFATSTSAKLIGTWATTNFTINIGTSGGWAVADTFDNNTCCGGFAYGIDNETKQPVRDVNYHSDLGKVFNNNKNKTHSNRFPENRNTYNLPTITPITDSARTDHSYPFVDDSGNVLIDGGYPVFGKTLPYYGPFHETDRFDGDIRHDSKYNTTTGRNYTCYSKKATLDIFPDCLTQYVQYNECETSTEKFSTNRLSRFAFVYRGCNFHEKCEFDEQGLPLNGWSGSAPTGIEDLKRGLAGQEIYMYLNLSNAWGGEIARCPCDCSEEPPDGNIPPEMVEVASPITFPCLINYDLRPTEYGCDDIRHQINTYRTYVSTDYEHDFCDPFPEVPECCNIRQPYTTYGFMRNLCGKEDRSRKNVITEAFANLVQNGTYRNTTPSVNVDEPMYWEFENEGPQPPPYTDGDWNEDASNGFTNSGLYPYWGLADGNGNLVAPYFTPKAGTFTCCPADSPTQYVDFDPSGTFYNGWPTDKVPFLIEIDHTDVCAGCSTISMASGDLVMSMESLNTSYSHNSLPDSPEGGKYGYNNCRYEGTAAALDPVYSCASGYPTNYCSSGDAYYPEYGVPYVGETCACITGTEITLKPKMLGTGKLPLGWISNIDGQNSFVNLSGCKNIESNYLNDDYFSGAAGGYSVYASFRLACDGNLQFLDDPIFPYAFYEGSPVTSLWSCNDGSCAHTYPAGGNNLKLNARMFLVSDGRRSDFEAIPEQDLIGPFASDIMTNGIKVGEPIDDGSRNIIICPGETVFVYGCALGGSFYPCNGCSPTSVCTSCSGQGVVCDDCGNVDSVNGYPTRRVPIHYEFNECKCACSTPSLVRWYDVNSSGDLILASSLEPYGCTAAIYWLAVSGADRGMAGPWILPQAPPFLHIGVQLPEINAVDFCSFQQGVNAVMSGVEYKFTEPYTDTPCTNLWPQTCDAGACEDSRAQSSVCGDPIAYLDGDFNIRKKACYPETMLVNKVTCVEDGFMLSVSREYHSHDRTWYKTQINDDATISCIPKQTGAYTYGGCTNLMWAVPTDTVTPAYDGNCSIHPSSGEYANQDFLFTNRPVSSGDTLWNYYNVFEPIGPDYLPASNDACTTETQVIFDYLFSSGEVTNKQYSCIQDIRECGGDFFCNKMFFPRRRYATGTKVTPFGALEICTQNAKLNNPDYYTGFQSFNYAPELILESNMGRFVDSCSANGYATTMDDIEINSTEIFVDDYLPLIGIVHPSWKNTVNLKSCIIPTTGECDGVTLPYTHNDSTLMHLYKGPSTFTDNNFGAMGYFYDPDVSGNDNCIFSQFKILVDVECCPDRIKRLDNELDDPTFLNFAFTDVSAGVCRGMVTAPACTCGSSVCNDMFINEGQCIPFYLVTNSWPASNCGGDDIVMGTPTLVGDRVIDYNPGFTSSPITIFRSTCASPPIAVTLFNHPCYPGEHFERQGPYYTRGWVCDDTVYTLDITSSLETECCDVLGSQCAGIEFGHKFLASDTCVIASENISTDSVTDPTANWRTKCGCVYSPGNDTICPDNSLIKVTITEAI